MTKVQRSRADEFETRIQAIDSLYKIHTQEYIPEITKYDRYVRETVIYFSDSKVWFLMFFDLHLLLVTSHSNFASQVTSHITLSEFNCYYISDNFIFNKCPQYAIRGPFTAFTRS